MSWSLRLITFQVPPFVPLTCKTIFQNILHHSSGAAVMVAFALPFPLLLTSSWGRFSEVDSSMSDIKKKNEETSTSDGNKTVFWSTHIAILHDCMFELRQQLKLHSQKTKRSDHLAGLVKVAYQCLSSRFVQALCYLHFFTRSLNFNTSHCCCLNSINFVSSSTPRSDIEVVGASVFFF